jgi:outer membrane protein OmpA-like peptidoglycan-associated protein
MIASRLLVTTAFVSLGTVSAGAQSVPLYSVTVVDRTVSAVDYQYRNGPTPIDFRGTVLLPEAKGQAVVESKSGRTEIDAKFEHLLPPARYGREYLTYVLWAITPEGHSKNLGEVLTGSSDKAHLRVTTDLQAFGMIVTAEPYSAVRLPGNVVVLENSIRPDTIGNKEPIQAKVELLPRGNYTYQVPENGQATGTAGRELSMKEYQQVVEIYQAQNAVQIAAAAGADRYASDTYTKAQDLLNQARAAQSRRAGMSAVVTLARHAAQTAEDARTIAIQHKQQDELAQAREQAARAEASRAQAEAAAQTAQTQAAAAQALLEQERAARRRAENQPAAVPASPPPAPVAPAQPAPAGNPKAALRMRLFEQCNSVMPAIDSPRGLVLTIPDSDFHEANVSSRVYQQLARISAILSANRGLTIEVDGNERFSRERAEAVRDLLVRDGLPAAAVTARDLGDSRPLGPDREQNQRVEITISGDPIGDMPYWSKSNNLVPAR